MSVREGLRQVDSDTDQALLNNQQESEAARRRLEKLSTPEARLASEHVIETLTGTDTPFHRIVETRNPMFGKTVDTISSNAQDFAEEYLDSMWLLTGENWGNTEEPGEFTPAQAQVIMTLVMEHREKAEELAVKQTRFNDIEGVEFDDYLSNAQSRYANILAAQIGMVRRGAIWNMEKFEVADTKEARDAFLRAPNQDDRELAMTLISGSDYYYDVQVPGINTSVSVENDEEPELIEPDTSSDAARFDYAEVIEVVAPEGRGDSSAETSGSSDEVDVPSATSSATGENGAPTEEGLEVDAPRRVEAGAATAEEATVDESEEEQKGVKAWFKARWNNLRTKKESRRKLYAGLGLSALFGGLIVLGVASEDRALDPATVTEGEGEPGLGWADGSTHEGVPTVKASPIPTETSEVTEEASSEPEVSEEQRIANEEAAESLFNGSEADQTFERLAEELFPEN